MKIFVLYMRNISFIFIIIYYYYELLKNGSASREPNSPLMFLIAFYRLRERKVRWQTVLNRKACAASQRKATRY